MRSLIATALAVAAGSCLAAPAAFAQISAPVPLSEPESWAIMAVGLVGVVLAVRRNRRK